MKNLIHNRYAVMAFRLPSALYLSRRPITTAWDGEGAEGGEPGGEVESGAEPVEADPPVCRACDLGGRHCQYFLAKEADDVRHEPCEGRDDDDQREGRTGDAPFAMLRPCAERGEQRGDREQA